MLIYIASYPGGRPIFSRVQLKRSGRLGTRLVNLGAALPGRLPGVGAYHSTGQNSYLGAYPGVGACPGDYGNYYYYLPSINLLFCGHEVIVV